MYQKKGSRNRKLVQIIFNDSALVRWIICYFKQGRGRGLGQDVPVLDPLAPLPSEILSRAAEPVPGVPEEALQAGWKALVPYDFDNPLFLVQLAFLHDGPARFL